VKKLLLLLAVIGLLRNPSHAAEPAKPLEPTNAAEAAAKKAAEDAATDVRYQALVATLPPDQQAWDVIHFNFGIHDRNTPPADYEKRLEQIIERLKKTGAKLIWASTTPIPTDGEKKQTAESIVERNAIAARLMQKHGIATDDLFTFITPHLATAQNPNDVHFTGPGYQMLGQQVAASISSALGAKAP
jgi:lysophospholipase L1-like esterase